jgi:nucleoside-diphosphate-sugar epimerase
MEKILITGGTGFIGSRLALRLISDGHQVRVYGQKNTTAETENAGELRRAGAEMIFGSMLDRKGIKKITEDVDIVYHLAAAQHEANVPDKVFWDVNYKGTELLTQACIKEGIRRLVHGSTIGVYGSALDGIISEDSPCRPDNIYGETKLAAEKMLSQYSNDLEIVIIRISETYGPGDRRLLKLFKGIQNKQFPLIGKGDNIHHLVFIDDLLNGLINTSANSAAPGECFVLSGKEHLSTIAMMQIVADVIGQDLPSLRVPLFPVEAVALLMEKTLRPMGIQPPLHRRRMDFFKKSYYFSQEKVSTILGFHPQVAFKDGAIKTIEWYRSYGLMR